MPSRFEYERAVRASGLPPMSRLMALTLATWADLKTGAIPSRLMPSLSKLEEATGMARGSVRTHLDRLETDGWLVRKRPPIAAARAEKARTQYKLRIPKGVAVSDSDGYELGQELTPAGAADAPDDQRLGQELPQARAGAAPELGQELTMARAGAALSSSLNDLSTSEYQQARQGAFPDRLEPLRSALAAAGLGAVAWDVRRIADWQRIHRQTERLGIDLMVKSALNGVRAMGEPGGITAWISRWESLADPQPDSTGGQVVPINVGRQQQETDDWFERAMARAKARDAQETS